MRDERVGGPKRCGLDCWRCLERGVASRCVGGLKRRYMGDARQRIDDERVFVCSKT